ncbi:uncharacterized protein EDB91DRAFT_1076832 [Suillus paluster]|uniref:uncharacterized protein n=1 Tax=Suillus paluster TaxID=48578 RepID=UPI001B86EF62|nr:uncharacterized protein EDB91DRAFT_1076832 [Suillus paluster]KAG1754719.1 hypothetical protein EDB91DRAFT_1076832 [Suillus paluster]
MPFLTERQKAAESMLEAYLAALVAESQVLVDPTSSSSDLSSSGSSDSSESDDDWLMPTTSDVLLGVVGSLYSRRYLVDREPIVKTGKNLCLLLVEWKFTQPEIFRAYVRVTPDCFDVLVSALQDDPVFHSHISKTLIWLQRHSHTRCTWGDLAVTL